MKKHKQYVYLLTFLLVVASVFSNNILTIKASYDNSIKLTMSNYYESPLEFSSVNEAIEYALSDTNDLHYDYTINLNGNAIYENINITFDTNQTHHKNIIFSNGTFKLDTSHKITIVDNTTFESNFNSNHWDVRFNSIGFDIQGSKVINLTGTAKKYLGVVFFGNNSLNPIVDNRSSKSSDSIFVLNKATMNINNTVINSTAGGAILTATDSDTELNNVVVNSNIKSNTVLFYYIGDTVISNHKIIDSTFTADDLFRVEAKNTGNSILTLTNTNINSSGTICDLYKSDAINTNHPTFNYASGKITTQEESTPGWGSDFTDTINSSNEEGSRLTIDKDVIINDSKELPLTFRLNQSSTPHHSIWTINSTSTIHGKLMCSANSIDKLILNGTSYDHAWDNSMVHGNRVYTDNADITDIDHRLSVYPVSSEYPSPYEIRFSINKGSDNQLDKVLIGQLQSRLQSVYMANMNIGDTITFLNRMTTYDYTITLPISDDKVWLDKDNNVVKEIDADTINNGNYSQGVTYTLAECNHTNTEIKNKVNPTCTESGYSGDTYCADCEKKLQTGQVENALGHDWSNWNITEDSTCSKVGSKYRTCSVCEETETLEIAKDSTKHSLIPISKVEATCTENGSDAHYTCEYCGKLFTDSQGINETTATNLIIQSNGHVPGEPVQSNVIDPTCTTKGSYTETITCTKCGETISVTNKQSDSLGHDWGEWTTITPATESSAGLEVRICTRDASHTENRIIPQLTHMHTGVLKSSTNATCIEPGNNAYYECSGCHKLFTDVNCTIETDLDSVTIPALGHQLTHHDAVPAKFENGNIAYDSCDRCNKLFLSDGTETTINDIVVAVPIYENINVISDITNPQSYTVTLTFTKNDNPIFEYSNEGIVKAEVTNTEIIASDNGMTYKKTITISALRAGNTTILIESPWNGNVIVGYNCTSTVNEHNHSYVKHSHTDATCTEDGNEEYWECSQCHKCFNDDLGTTEINKDDMILPKTGHSFNTLVEATASTCTKEGNIAYYECSNCHKYFDTDKTTELTTISIPKTKHTLVHIPAKDPTNTEPGNIEYWQCSVCDTMFGDGVGENEVSISDVIINITNICKHDHTKIKNPIDVTCTEYGFTGQTVCEDCGETIDTGKVLDPLGHNIESVKAKAATLTSEGYKAHYKCSRCYTLFTDAEGKNQTSLENLKIAKLININKATISGINASYNYTNALIKPTVKVVYNKKTLKLNTDYTVSYAKNKNVGTATVTIKGKGLYGGSINKTFKIVYPTIKARAYTQNKWQSWASISSVNKIMTIGTGKLLQGYQLKLTNNSGYINYKAYVQKTGWQDVKSTKTSAISGTKTSKRVEMVSFTPKGNMATSYDVYYRAYVSGKGWTNWAKNGVNVGSKGLSKAITKVQIKYVKKGTKVAAGNSKAIFTK